MQQLLSSILSVFCGIGVWCFIEYFENDIDKIVNAFTDFLPRFVVMEAAQYGAWNTWV